VRLRFAGLDTDVAPADVAAACRRLTPDPQRVHWVEVDGRHFPPKQVVSAVTHRAVQEFTSHQALHLLRALGFATSPMPGESSGAGRPPVRDRDTAVSVRDAIPLELEALADASRMLGAFLGEEELTSRLSGLERALVGLDGARAGEIVAGAGLTEELLESALLVRRRIGRVSDVIHAAVIGGLLPTLLEEHERVVVAPSLGAGNDPSRHFDLETDRRVAEFKLAEWKGADAMRQRGVFADLLTLAFDESGRRAQLFVVGDRPQRWLSTSTTSVGWALGRGAASARARFAERVGPDTMTVADFRAGPAADVEIVDLTTLRPELSRLLAEG
jgi:hypothetical protein